MKFQRIMAGIVALLVATSSVKASDATDIAALRCAPAAAWIGAEALTPRGNTFRFNRFTATPALAILNAVAGWTQSPANPVPIQQPSVKSAISVVDIAFFSFMAVFGLSLGAYSMRRLKIDHALRPIRTITTDDPAEWLMNEWGTLLTIFPGVVMVGWAAYFAFQSAFFSVIYAVLVGVGILKVGRATPHYFEKYTAARNITPLSRRQVFSLAFLIVSAGLAPLLYWLIRHPGNLGNPLYGMKHPLPASRAFFSMSIPVDYLRRKMRSIRHSLKTPRGRWAAGAFFVLVMGASVGVWHFTTTTPTTVSAPAPVPDPALAGLNPALPDDAVRIQIYKAFQAHRRFHDLIDRVAWPAEFPSSKQQLHQGADAFAQLLLHGTMEYLVPSQAGVFSIFPDGTGFRVNIDRLSQVTDERSLELAHESAHKSPAEERIEKAIPSIESIAEALRPSFDQAKIKAAEKKLGKYGERLPATAVVANDFWDDSFLKRNPRLRDKIARYLSGMEWVEAEGYYMNVQVIRDEAIARTGNPNPDVRAYIESVVAPDAARLGYSPVEYMQRYFNRTLPLTSKPSPTVIRMAGPYLLAEHFQNGVFSPEFQTALIRLSIFNNPMLRSLLVGVARAEFDPAFSLDLRLLRPAMREDEFYAWARALLFSPSRSPRVLYPAAFHPANGHASLFRIAA